MKLPATVAGLKTAFIDMPAGAIASAGRFAFTTSTVDRSAGPSVGMSYFNNAANVAGLVGMALTPVAIPIYCVGKGVSALVSVVLSAPPSPGPQRPLLASALRSMLAAVGVGAATGAAAYFGLPLELGAIAALPAAAADLRDLGRAYAPQAA